MSVYTGEKFSQHIYVCYLMERTHRWEKVVSILPTIEDARLMGNKYRNDDFHFLWSECPVDCGDDISWYPARGELVFVAFSPGQDMSKELSPIDEDPNDIRAFLVHKSAVEFLRGFNNDWENHAVWPVELGWEAEGIKETLLQWVNS